MNSDEQAPPAIPLAADGMLISQSAGIQVGDNNVQHVHYYGKGTWTARVPQAPAAGTPYPGLNAFEERDHVFFFGRDAAVSEVMGRLQASNCGILVVSGVSGAGKSSLLHAGILPRLRRDGLAGMARAAWWPCLLLTPGTAPLDELAAQVAVLAGVSGADARDSLARDPAGFRLLARQAVLARQAAAAGHPGSGQGGRLLLIIDQFEQLFTRCSAEAERRALIAALHSATAAPDPVALAVLGLRADFEARCAEYPQLAPAIQDRWLLTAMGERDLRLAITEPARQAGVRVEPELTDQLLREIQDRRPAVTAGASAAPGVLPLLSYALAATWSARTGDALTLADYDRTGGIEAAVATAAQRAYDTLTAPRRDTARQVFLQLVASSDDGTETAIPAPRASLDAGSDPDDVRAVLDAFAAERLLTLTAGSVQITHEALLTSWPLLRDTWLAETRADRIIFTALRAAAAEWESRSRDPSYLYRGTLLEAAGMARRAGGSLAHGSPAGRTERDFLRASEHARRRAERWRRAAVTGLAALTAAAVALAGLALRNAASAASLHAIALSRQLAADSLAIDAGDPVTARRLAVAAWKVHPTSEASSAMSALVDEQQREGILPVAGPGAGVADVAFSPDGRLLATLDGNGRARLWNTATGLPAPVPLARIPLKGITAVAFSPSGLLAATGADGMIRLWNPATGKPGGRPAHDSAPVMFGPGGTMVTLAGRGPEATLLNLRTGRPAGSRLDLPPDISMDGSALSTDGRLLAIAITDTHGNGSLLVWDASTGKLVRDVAPTDASPSPAVDGVAISPDGRLLASADDDGTAEVWDLSSGQPAGPPISADTGPDGTVNAVAFSPDGLLATADSDGTVRLWNPATGEPAGAPIPASPERRGVAAGVTFSGNGKILATNDNVPFSGNIVRLWNPATGQPVSHPIPAGGGIFFYTIALSPDGKLLATIDDYDTFRLWHTATGRPAGKPVENAASAAFSPDGRLLAIARTDGTVRLQSLTADQPARAPFPPMPRGSIIAVAFTSRGTLLAAASDGTIRQWNPATGKTAAIRLPQAAGRNVAEDVFSPDGRFMAASEDQGTWQLWNLSARRPVGPQLPESTGPDGYLREVAFSPDDTLLAIAYANGTLQLWNLATDKPARSPIPADTGTNATVDGVAFSPDGSLLASADSDRTAGGTVQLWKLAQIASPYATLCAQAGAPTPEELKRYAAGESIPAACS